MNTVLEKYRKLPWGSALLVTANIVIFVICTFTGEKIYRLGMLDAYDVTIKGEYGRLLWAMFLHSGVTHLFNNMLILAFLGAMLEKEMGHWRFLMCYFVSGIGGNLFSLTSKLISRMTGLPPLVQAGLFLDWMEYFWHWCCFTIRR